MGGFAMPAQGTAMLNPGSFGSSGSSGSGGGFNINPTGANGFGGTTPSWGGGNMSIYGAPTGSSGYYGFGASANPYSSVPGASIYTYGGGGYPTTSMNPGSAPSVYGGTGAGTGGTTAPIMGNLGKGSATLSQLNNPLGSGIGPQVQQFLNSNGGYNSPLTQQAVDAQVQAMQSQIQQGMGNLETGLGAAGINPNSSAAALETSNYESNAVAQENALTAQEFFNMWNTSMGNETSVLEAAMQASAQRQQQQYTSGFDWASMIIGAVDPLAAAKISKCWIAAAVFGEDFLTGVKTNLVRNWLWNEWRKHWYAKPVLWLYSKIGQRIARRPMLVSALAPLFWKALKKAQEE